jgi:hypothetical protein
MWSASYACHVTPGRKATGVVPGASLNDTQKWRFLTLPEIELQPLSQPACRQFQLKPQQITVTENSLNWHLNLNSSGANLN